MNVNEFLESLSLYILVGWWGLLFCSLVVCSLVVDCHKTEVELKHKPLQSTQENTKTDNN